MRYSIPFLGLLIFAKLLGCAPEASSPSVSTPVNEVPAVSTAPTADSKIAFSEADGRIAFRGSKPDGSGHDGGFKKFSGTADVDETSSQVKAITVTIDTTSLFSDDEKLTGHLKNVDFFDTNEHPTAVFTANKFTPIENEPGKFSVEGELTLLGKPAPIKFPAQMSVTGKKLIFIAKFALDRTQHGMVYGEGKINPEVDMTIEIGAAP